MNVTLGGRRSAIYIDVIVFHHVVNFLVDTGSSVSIVSDAVFKSLKKERTIERFSPPTALLNNSHEKITVLGALYADVSYKEKTACILFYVTNKGTSLLGLDAIQALDLHILGTAWRCFQTQVEGLGPSSGRDLSTNEVPHTDYKHLFVSELGHAKGYVQK
ncbi:unnamed protein product [Ixodes pacificus]